MKLIEINATYGIGSTGRIVADLMSEAELNNIDVGVAYQSADRSHAHAFKVGCRLDRAYHGAMTRILGRQGYSSRRATKKLLAWLDSERPDVVHLHNLHSNFINLGMLLTYLSDRDIATVITLHDCWFFTGKCFHFVESGCDRWQTGCHDCPRNKLDIKSLFFDSSKKVWQDKKALYERIPRLYTVGCSRWITELAQKSILSSGEVLHIYNGVDTKGFSPRKTDFKERLGVSEKFILTGAANKWLLPENKELFDSFIRERREDEVLILFGSRAEHFAAVKGAEGVLPLGYLNADEMAELFSAADVFVNPPHADTLPTVNMEAASCGTPVVTYDVCGSPELVVDGVTGYVVAEGDSLAMLDAVRRVRSRGIDPAACREHAVGHFDKNENYKAYIRLFKNIAEGERVI